MLQALSSPRRREILRLVWDDELPAGEIAARFTDVTWPAISQNLGVLLRVGAITERREGRRRLYVADRDALGPLADAIRVMWVDDLSRLASLAEGEQQGQASG